MKHTISVLVENHAGVLSRITGLFSRRGFNIDSLAVGVTEDKTVSRMTIVVEGDAYTVEQLEKQLEGYRKFHSEAREILNRNGYDEKGLGTFEKIRTYLMVNLQTLADDSTSHIAKMLIQGSSMGITEAVKKLHQYENDVEKDIKKLMERLQEFEEGNVERLKEFL